MKNINKNYVRHLDSISKGRSQHMPFACIEVVHIFLVSLEARHVTVSGPRIAQQAIHTAISVRTACDTPLRLPIHPITCGIGRRIHRRTIHGFKSLCELFRRSLKCCLNFQCAIIACETEIPMGEYVGEMVQRYRR